MEAVADWHSVQKTKGRTNESFPEWYNRLRDKLPIDEETRGEINKRLGFTKKAEYILEKQAISLHPRILKGKMAAGIQKALKKYPKAADRVARGVKHYTKVMTETAGMPPGSSELVFATQFAKHVGRTALKHVDKVGDKVYSKLQKLKIVK
jgi:hypothetical protein